MATFTDKASSNSSSFVLLAPSDGVVPAAFQSVWRDQAEYNRVLTQMQKMRGRVALAEGAVLEKDLRPGRRHEMAGDTESWHIIKVRGEGQMLGCARILVHPERAPYSSLRLSRSPLATHHHWSDRIRQSVEEDMRRARQARLRVVEPGGWVVEEPLKFKADAISIALSAFAWSQLAGGCLAYVTATVKHKSSAILRRLGGDSIRFEGQEMPRYYDPEYRTEMELVRLETRSLNSRFESTMAPLRELLAESPVIQAEPDCAMLAA
jgi:hypothetical protein